MIVMTRFYHLLMEQGTDGFSNSLLGFDEENGTEAADQPPTGSNYIV